MNILILNGSPRADGNTAALAAAFAEGAASAGHSVKTIQVGTMNIRGCVGCMACRGNGGVCVQKDDMTAVYPELQKAELIVLASPVYFWALTGQMQSAVTRFFAIGRPAAKEYVLLLSSGRTDVYEGPLAQYAMLQKRFNVRSRGVFTFAGNGQQTEENFGKLRRFAASL